MLEREQLPGEIDKPDNRYRQRLKKVFKQHPEAGGNFEHFWEAQLVWDESMAERVAEYLSAHPDKALVILAGSGHVEFGSGISNRVRRRLPGLRMTVLVTADKPQSKPDLVDYTLVSRKQALPAAPKMGIALDRSDGVRVKGVTPGGPAAHSGIKPNDHIVALEGVDIKSTGDVRLALLDKKPGDHVLIQVRRQDAAGTQDLRFEITLQ